MHKPNRISGAERASGCRSSVNSVLSTQVVVVPETWAKEVFASITFP